MEKLVHISLLQKHHRQLQNYRRLCEDILPVPITCDELRRYLKAEEEFFYQEYCEDLELLRHENVELTKLQEQGVQFTYIGDILYPPSFLGMPGAPLLLSFKGNPAWHWGKMLAVVGSREATSLSHLWMEEHLAQFLKQEKPVVVSGGARGIDQMAHQLAIRNNCPTIAVIPSGLGVIYPQNLAAWQEKIYDGGGCLLSEYPYFERMRKHFFHDRNRLIAGLGITTLLVEARRRSGTLITAQKTLQFGKSVLVVPGHPSDASHLGNLDLLSEGATPIRDATELSMYFRSEVRMLPEDLSMASESLRILNL